jgi:hypothetical protein
MNPIVLILGGLALLFLVKPSAAGAAVPGAPGVKLPPNPGNKALQVKGPTGDTTVVVQPNQPGGGGFPWQVIAGNADKIGEGLASIWDRIAGDDDSEPDEGP